MQQGPPHHGPPQPGYPPYGQSQPGQSPYAQPAPQYGEAQYGETQIGRPQFRYGQSEPGQAPPGQPQHAQTQHAQPQDSRSRPGQTPYGQSLYGQTQPGQDQPGQIPYGQTQPGQSPYAQAGAAQAGFGQHHQPDASAYGGQSPYGGLQAGPQTGPQATSPGPYQQDPYPQTPHPAVGTSAFDAPAAPPSSRSSVSGAVKVIAALTLLAAIGVGIAAFLPWVVSESGGVRVSANGIGTVSVDGSTLDLPDFDSDPEAKDGVLTLAAAIVVALFALVSVAIRKVSPMHLVSGVFALLGGLGIAAIGVIDVLDVKDQSTSFAEIEVGYGLWATLGLGIVLVILGIVGIVKRR